MRVWFPRLHCTSIHTESTSNYPKCRGWYSFQGPQKRGISLAFVVPKTLILLNTGSINSVEVPYI